MLVRRISSATALAGPTTRTVERIASQFSQPSPLAMRANNNAQDNQPHDLSISNNIFLSNSQPAPAQLFEYVLNDEDAASISNNNT